MYSKFQRHRASPAPAMNCTLRSTDGHDGACLQHLHFSGQAIVQLLMMILIKEGPNQMATDPTHVNRKIPHMVLRRKKGLRIKQSWGLEMTSDSKDRKLHIYVYRDRYTYINYIDVFYGYTTYSY